MNCSYCGAAVFGRFCHCCGKKVLGSIEAFRKEERKTLKNFIKEVGPHHQLANACWYACQEKYGREVITKYCGEFVITPDAYEKLALVEEKARALFLRLINLDDF